MLGRSELNNAKEGLKSAIAAHEAARANAVEASRRLYAYRSEDGPRLVALVEAYVNTMKKTPAEFSSVFEEYNIKYSLFKDVIEEVNAAINAADIKTGAGVGTGVAAGAATAFMGPTAAMAVATTFGTASTGTAISTLSGAVATKAALAWLGGGAVAAGGGGVVAGNALLALAGPVGWALAGASVVGGIAYSSHSNKQKTTEIVQKTWSIKAECNSIKVCATEATELGALTKRTIDGLHTILKDLRDNHKVTSLEGQAPEVLDKFAAMLNHVRSLGELMLKKVSVK